MESREKQSLPGVGHSMLPSILPRARIETEAFSAGIGVGDVICYLGERPQVVAHRVMAVRGEAGARVYLTRGDAQAGCEEVPEHAVLAKVVRVDHFGAAYRTDGPIGRLFRQLALREEWRWRFARAFATDTCLGALWLRRACLDALAKLHHL